MGKGGDDAVWNVWYFFSVFLEKKKILFKKKKKNRASLPEQNILLKAQKFLAFIKIQHKK